jgi:pimeloyl-ACP methyl ester carboxylesterase
MHVSENVLYLLGGNGSYAAWFEDCLPHFTHLCPVPVELPGSGDNASTAYDSLESLARALIAQTQPGHTLFAVGINALVALHAEVLQPGHFKKLVLLAPVGAFLWRRGFVKFMSLPPMRKLSLFLLRTFPKLFARKFSPKRWTDAQYNRMAEGYRRSRAFEAYFEFVQPYNALTLFEWITAPIELIWGRADAVLNLEQAAAWDAILPRADLQVTIKDGWAHYPYIDDPADFAAHLEGRARARTFRAHSKAGRLTLAALAGLPVPHAQTVSQPDADSNLTLDPRQTYAVRSSASTEDQADASNAGRNRSFLRVPADQVPARVHDLFADGIDEVAVQVFVEPRASGVAFARTIGIETEWVEGHLSQLVDGTRTPNRLILSRMGGDWSASQSSTPPFPLAAFEKFIRDTLRTFHFAPADIEWAWDGATFWLLQTRPVVGYPWRRLLTSANLDEILPAQVSRLMEHAQRRAASTIPQIYALWDPRVLEDAEPFTTPHANASYINSDLFLSRFNDWGLPSALYAREIGGAVPRIPFNPLVFAANIPMFLRMLWLSRAEIDRIPTRSQAFAAELETLTDSDAIARWFVRFYVFIVQSNFLITAALTSSGGGFLGKPRTVYADVTRDAHAFAHRMPYESDPATPRPDMPAPPLQAHPQWPGWIRALHRLGAPVMGGYYFVTREWFRDQHARLFFRMHQALRGTAWLKPHEASRDIRGTFWQDSGAAGVSAQSESFVIYPGAATGVVGRDILIVDALDAGQFEDYRRATAVIARSGGRLSHGATLLRELRKPSAVIGDAPQALDGQTVRYRDGQLSLM